MTPEHYDGCMTHATPALSRQQRAEHRRWLFDLTQIPSAAGREDRVLRWIEAWASARPGVNLTKDDAGNLTLTFRAASPADRPVYFTAHLDHPAFVVERIVAPGVVQVSFRGGVMAEYFDHAPIAIFTAQNQRLSGTLSGSINEPGPFTHYLAEVRGDARAVSVGDVGVWDLPAAEEIDGCIHTLACDDLAAAAAALSAFDTLLHAGVTQDVRLLFTRAEEIGFIGAIAACRLGTVPKGARVIALENSRSFADSPIGGGPIVRVGDRLSIFSPTLTDAIAKRAEQIAGAPSTVTAQQKLAAAPAWKWQRKLMAGGACEASVFCNAGYEATCVCLPLGNYHNMGNLADVQAGTHTGPARIEREFVSLADYDGLVDLLIACGIHMPATASLGDRFESLYTERSFVLNARPTPTTTPTTTPTAG